MVREKVLFIAVLTSQKPVSTKQSTTEQVSKLAANCTIKKMVLKRRDRTEQNMEEFNSVLCTKVCPNSARAVTEERNHRNTLHMDRETHQEHSLLLYI